MIINNLSTILGSRLLSITNVHNKTGISRSTLSTIYNKSSANVTVSTLIKLCNYLQVPLSEIIEYIPDKKQLKGGE